MNTIEAVLERNRNAGKKPNRLITEKSPYLLQHAFNPVDWYPWGEEAFAEARRADKPIFLSVGYSTCYWCHVMEREVFEDEAIAAMMNQHVLSIKVDREERPDVDRIYMNALQAMTGSGGWPMSMFLTPELVPFFGATYIPPEAKYGRAGFPDILNRIQNLWITDRQRVYQIGREVENALRQGTTPPADVTPAGVPALESGFRTFSRSYDSRHGGFGGAPKFPRPVSFNFLFRYFGRTGERRALEMSLETLRRMANGGIYDHIGGGFHRYATDERWHVPHFEKMLYDQALLVVSYLEAYQISRDPFFAAIARDVLRYVQRSMTHPDGGFCSAEDAESARDPATPEQKSEGAFYTWTKDELDRLLAPDEADVFHYAYGVNGTGNVSADPHQVFAGANILSVAHSPEETAGHFGLKEAEVVDRLRRAKEQLLQARAHRPAPHLDDKILVSWNGLMISALARAYQVLGDRTYLDSAERSARFILATMYRPNTGELLRRYRDGEARHEAHLEDYAYLVQGMLDLYEAALEIFWLSSALALTDQMIKLFYDEQHGGFFDVSGNDTSILVRSKEWYDGAEPSGNAIAVLNLLRLGHMTNRRIFQEIAQRTLAFFGGRMLNSPHAVPQLLVALDFSLSKPLQIIVAGNAGDANTSPLLKEIHSRFIPNKVMLLADGADAQRALSEHIPFLANVAPIAGKPTVYICRDYACELPASEAADVARLLDGMLT